jgi:hypothetical protein
MWQGPKRKSISPNRWCGRPEKRTGEDGTGCFGVSHGVTKADECGTMRRGDGTEGDGDGVGFGKGVGVRVDRLTEVLLMMSPPFKRMVSPNQDYYGVSLLK